MSAQQPQQRLLTLPLSICVTQREVHFSFSLSVILHFLRQRRVQSQPRVPPACSEFPYIDCCLFVFLLAILPSVEAIQFIDKQACSIQG